MMEPSDLSLRGWQSEAACKLLRLLDGITADRYILRVR